MELKVTAYPADRSGFMACVAYDKQCRTATADVKIHLKTFHRQQSKVLASTTVPPPRVHLLCRLLNEK